jgi:hypothetical protein
MFKGILRQEVMPYSVPNNFGKQPHSWPERKKLIMLSEDRTSTATLARHFRILGICWVLYGILKLVSAVWLALVSNTATLMFGALLNRVPNPFAMMDVFHVFYGFLILLSGIIGILGVMSGLALLSGSRSGRPLAVCAAFLALSSIPLGTTLGIYTLIVLLNWAPVQAPAAVPGASVSNFKSQPQAM